MNQYLYRKNYKINSMSPTG